MRFMPIAVVVGFVCLLAAGPSYAADSGTEAASTGKRILYFDPEYSTRFVSRPAEVARYFQKRGFETKNADQLAEWMRQVIDNHTAAGTVVLNFTGITPRNIAEPFDQEALVYRYCAAGGRFVMGGGNVLYLFQGKSDVRIYQQWENEDIPKRMLGAFGIKPVYGMSGRDVHVTEEGKKWGLSDGPWNGQFLSGGAMPAAQVTRALAVSADGVAATAWQVNVNSKYPYSGLVGFAAFQVTPDNEPMLAILYKLATFDGKTPATVPQADWRTPPAVDPPVRAEFSMKPAEAERRAYLRGEVIPLHVRVLGAEYTGQAVSVSLEQGGKPLWSRTYAGATPVKEILESVTTADLRSGEYQLSVRLVDDKGPAVAAETIWVCSPRPNNAYFLAVGQGIDENPLREEITLRWQRNHNLNVNYYYGDRMVRMRDPFSRFLDQAMRNNLMVNANLGAIPLLVDQAHKSDAIELPDGRNIKEGEKYMTSSRAMVNVYADAIRDGFKHQSGFLRQMGSPIIRPIMVTNDDSTYSGHIDFSRLTQEDFTQKTGIPWDQVPRPVLMSGNNFRGEHAEGVIADDDRWLAYMRYQVDKYRKVLDLTMQGVQSGWPGALVAQIPCMSGPMYIERSLWPPIDGLPINTTSFYLYHWLGQYYTFSAEAARMNNRGRPSVYTISSSYLTWGAIHQRLTTYATLAENPAGVTLYMLDHPPAPRFQDREKEQYEELSRIGARMSKIAGLVEGAQVPRRKAALFIGFAQTCFYPEDRDRQFAAFDNLLRAGADVELVSEDEIIAGRASDYQVIILNGIRWMQQSGRTALEKFIAGGGRVVCDAKTTIPIKGAIRLEEPLATTQMDYAGKRGIDLCRKLIERKILPVMAHIVPGEGGNTLVRPLDKGDQHLAWVLDVENEKQSRELEAARSGSRWADGQYEVLNAWAHQTPNVKKPLRIADGLFAYDLWNHRELELATPRNGWRTTSIEVELLGGALVALYPQRIGAFSSSSPPTEAKPGQPVTVTFSLSGRDAKPLNGQVPVEVRMYYPDGSEAWEYGQDALMTDGRLEVRWTPARNDPAGQWRIEARELCTGQKVSVTLNVAARAS